MNLLLSRFEIPELALRRATCLTFSIASTGPTKPARVNWAEQGWACQSLAGKQRPMAARLRFKVPPTKVRSFKFDYLSSKAELGSTGSLPFGSFLFKSFWVLGESLECSTSLEGMRAGAHFCSRAHMMRYRRFDKSTTGLKKRNMAVTRSDKVWDLGTCKWQLDRYRYRPIQSSRVRAG